MNQTVRRELWDCEVPVMRTLFEIFDAPEVMALLAFGLIATAAALWLQALV